LRIIHAAEDVKCIVRIFKWRRPALLSRVVMLVDLDYFFAQCEELRNPSIKDKPVVVCVYSGRTEDSGAVSTANYVARAYGVKSGIPIFLAKKKLENTNAVFLAVDYEFYEGISEKVMNVLKGLADRFEQVGIDEAFLDVTQKAKGNFEEGRKLAERVKSEVLRQERLTCSIGVAPNKLVAKISADTKKPDGLTVVTPDQITAFLGPLPVSRLIGVGTKTRERMEALGIKTISDLSNYDMERLIAVFGKTLATYFHNASLGIDDEPVQERGEATSISRIATLKHDSRELSFIVEKADQLCSEVHATIAKEGLAFKTVGIIVIATDMSIHTRSKTLENPTDNFEVFQETVRELFERFFDQTEFEARRVGVKIANFAKQQKSQRQLTSFIKENKD
jgi:DNA polymerase IV (DinB-like DNA polymerase)